MPLHERVTRRITEGIVLIGVVVLVGLVTSRWMYATFQRGPVEFSARGDGAVSNSSRFRQQSARLSDTSWQLVKFQGPVGTTTLAGEDRAKYTIEFGVEGQITTRVDCNRGRGTWQSSGGSKIELSRLALTRAKCPTGSLHDQIVKHWTEIKSYAIKEGHLFLSVTGNGGTYEFEPAAPKDR